MAEKRSRGDSDGVSNGVKRPRSDDGTPPQTTGAKPNIQDQLAALKAKGAASRERITGPKGAQTSAATATHSPADAARAKIDAIRARVAAATGKTAAATGGYQNSAQSSAPPVQDQNEDLSRARGGLGIGLHPALMGDVSQDQRAKQKAPIASRFSTTMGNLRPGSPIQRPTSEGKGKTQMNLAGPSVDELKTNPYYDPNVSGLNVGPKARKSRELLFHQKGKFIAQAAALRRQAHLEDMKRRIAESARKAGLDEDRSEQAFLVAEPPGVEWWDEGLVNGSAYPDFEGSGLDMEKLLKIQTEDSVVTRYIQHPVLLTPPQEKTAQPLKPMFMTKEEQAKKRRQDRMEVRKEKQAKVRLGLEPPEPAKVKKSNLMRVLGEQAVKDPTAVEARVNREIAERRDTHETTNEERKLTKEQRHEKLAENQDKDASKGIIVSVFRIDSLAYGKHRYQIDINAKQHALTGVAIMHPRLNLVIVEGGEHSIAKYKKLMLQRIKWTEIAPPSASTQDSANAHNKDVTEASWLKAEDENGRLKDLTENRCVLIWEGEERQRSFKKWGSRVCETDAEARRALEKSKMENMWQLAKNWTF